MDSGYAPPPAFVPEQRLQPDYQQYAQNQYAPPPSAPMYQQPVQQPNPYMAPPPQVQPQPVYMVQQQPQQVVMAPQPVYIQTQTQPATVVVNQKQGANHACHAILWCVTAGLWTPCWIFACFGCCCERPCNS